MLQAVWEIVLVSLERLQSLQIWLSSVGSDNSPESPTARALSTCTSRGHSASPALLTHNNTMVPPGLSTAVLGSPDLLPRILANLQLTALGFARVCSDWRDAVAGLGLEVMGLAGANVSGQLGLGNVTNVSSLHRVMPPNGAMVETAACGFYHTLILSKDGSLWVCGRNKDGQLGLGHNLLRMPTLQRMPLPPRAAVRAMACGQAHTCVIMADGTLWGCGSNEFGQLAIGGAQLSCASLQPAVVEGQTQDGLELVGAVSLVACGQHHTCVATEGGTVWSCGNGAVGQLGSGYAQASASLLQRASLQRVEEPHITAKPPLQLACGKANTFVLTAEGELLGCGWNNCGQCGIGHKSNVLTFKGIHLPMTGITSIQRVDRQCCTTFECCTTVECCTTAMDVPH